MTVPSCFVPRVYIRLKSTVTNASESSWRKRFYRNISGNASRRHSLNKAASNKALKVCPGDFSWMPTYCSPPQYLSGERVVRLLIWHRRDGARSSVLHLRLMKQSGIYVPNGLPVLLPSCRSLEL